MYRLAGRNGAGYILFRNFYFAKENLLHDDCIFRYLFLVIVKKKAFLFVFVRFSICSRRKSRISNECSEHSKTFLE